VSNQRCYEQSDHHWIPPLSVLENEPPKDEGDGARRGGS
jgi:hypothetical protein